MLTFMLYKIRALKPCMFHLFFIMLGLLISETAFSALPLYGFTVGNEPINPVCIYKMRPWVSDSEILIKSVNLRACHDSNWSFHPKPVVVEKGYISPKMTFVYTDNNEKNSEWDRAGYSIVGKTKKGTFVLFMGTDTGYGYDVVTYRINDGILTQVWDTHESCIKDATLVGSTLILKKYEDPDESEFSKANQCGKRLITQKYTID